MHIRLLHCKTEKFKLFLEAQAPPYAILSHTWNTPEEVTLQEMENSTGKKKAGYKKVTGTCRLALAHKIGYAWIDTCCIDKTNSAETDEAIRSMFRWYQKAAICFVYLSDLQSPDADKLRKCLWFTRGWTLQELLAPRSVEFYDSVWRSIGSKVKLASHLSKITLIPQTALLGQEPLRHYSIAQRMSWASRRTTTLVEDRAYCLQGIFDVELESAYGERQVAFQRLQEEIIKRHADLTVFAWLQAASQPGTVSTQRPLAHHNTPAAYSPLFASSPCDFELSYLTAPFRQDESEFEVTNRGLRIAASLVLLPFSAANGRSPVSSGTVTSGGEMAQRCRHVLLLGFARNTSSYVGIWLKKIGPDSYVRENVPSLARIPENAIGTVRTTESQVCYILLTPNALSRAAAGAPPTFPPMTGHAPRKSLLTSGAAASKVGEHASAAAKDSLRAVYHSRLYPGGIHIPSFDPRVVQINSLPERLWDERTRICCQSESPNDVVPISCTSYQGSRGDDKLSFGVLLDFRDRSHRPRCMVTSRLSPESSIVFLQAEPMKWHVLEHDLRLQMGPTLRFDSKSGHKYEITVSIVEGKVQIDGQVVLMSTLDIKIKNSAKHSWF